MIAGHGIAMPRDVLAIGCAAGFGGDRIDAAGPVVDTLIARGGPGVLIFEVLAERTLALAHVWGSTTARAAQTPIFIGPATAAAEIA
jgi:hypothetical protein